jgi:multicomponent Na+:H+ antiporter subunit E
MIQLFLLNLFLATVYVVLTDDLSAMNIVIGFLTGTLVTTLYARATGRPSYLGKIGRLLRFLGFFLRILTKANLHVAWEIITPGFRMTPRIIRYPVNDLTPVQVTTLANAITLTPGTLTVDVDEPGHYLDIHCMYAADPETAIADIDLLKRRLVREVFES